MDTNTKQLAMAIRHLYNTMSGLSKQTTLNGHRVEVSTGRKMTDPILVMVEDNNGNHVWLKASKRACAVNNLYSISEKAAQVIA